jgi:hypothetical protein
MLELLCGVLKTGTDQHQFSLAIRLIGGENKKCLKPKVSVPLGASIFGESMDDHRSRSWFKFTVWVDSGLLWAGIA